MPTTLQDEITAYEGMQRELEAKHRGQWVVIRDGELVGSYDDFQLAASEAVRRYGRGPYLMRQVGAPPPRLSSAALWQR